MNNKRDLEVVSWWKLGDLPRSGIDEEGSSSLLSTKIFIFGGGGGGGGLIADDPGDDVDETIAPEEILNSLMSVLYTIAAVCILQTK